MSSNKILASDGQPFTSTVKGDKTSLDVNRVLSDDDRTREASVLNELACMNKKMDELITLIKIIMS